MGIEGIRVSQPVRRDVRRDELPVKGCVSFSLYGGESRYAVGAVENVALVKKYYPGWECRFYVEASHYATDALRKEGANVIVMDGKSQGTGGAFWRFLACDDTKFTHVIIRDVDSRVNPREVVCVDEWIKSGKTLHLMKDHPDHKAKVLGGAWGIKPGVVDFKFSEEILKWRHSFKYGDDEKFLSEIVFGALWPSVDFIRHDFSVRQANNRTFPIPQHKPYNGFIGEQIRPTFQMPGKWRAVVISPDHYVERRRLFFDNLNKNGAFLKGKVEVVRGISLSELDIPVPPHLAGNPYAHLVTEDHKKLLIEGAESDLDYLFIFEDDAFFEPHFEDALTRAMMCIPDGWLMLMLGGRGSPYGDRKHYCECGMVKYPTALGVACGCYGTHGILWSKIGLIKAVEEIAGTDIIDIGTAKWQAKDGGRGFYTTWCWPVSVNPNTAQIGKAK